MSEYKLKTGKLGDKVIGTYRKVEDAFVDRYLTREGESVSQAKERLRKEEQARQHPDLK